MRNSCEYQGKIFNLVSDTLPGYGVRFLPPISDTRTQSETNPVLESKTDFHAVPDNPAQLQIKHAPVS